MTLLNVMVIIVAAIIVVALFMLGMGLTYIIKGHHIKSEIGTNPNMKKLGIHCTSQQIRDQERALRGDALCALTQDCAPTGCSSCGSYSEDEAAKNK